MLTTVDHLTDSLDIKHSPRHRGHLINLLLLLLTHQACHTAMVGQDLHLHHIPLTDVAEEEEEVVVGEMTEVHKEVEEDEEGDILDAAVVVIFIMGIILLA